MNKTISFKDKLKQNKVKTLAYVILRVLVLIAAFRQFSLGNYNGVFICVLTLVLFMIPAFVNTHFHVEFPNTLEIIILLFIFSAEILGELNRYYLEIEHWDTILHTFNGFLMAAIGFALIDIMNRSDKISISLTPTFVALTAFCFSMTTGVLWEFFEFGMDYFFLTDMQKDTVIPIISSVMFNPDGLNVPIQIKVDELIVNGQYWDYGGYIDIGIIDTMADLFVNFIGAVVFSVLGILYIKGRSNFAKHFMPTRSQK